MNYKRKHRTIFLIDKIAITSGKVPTNKKIHSEPIRAQSMNMQIVPRAGKQATVEKRGKTSKGCQARENIQPVLSRRGKI